MNSWKNAFHHLRIPYSLILSPVYLLAVLFALSQSSASVALVSAFWIFGIWHLLLYPSSQAYNSYYDQDTGSIGGLENPPPAGKETWILAILFEILALAAAFVWSVPFGVAVLAFSAASRLYSYPGVRLKKYPWISWLVVATFQGGVVVASTFYALTDLEPKLIAPGILGAVLWVGGVYPLTQVFQHDEDRGRGDHTLSLVLGVRGTVIFSVLMMGAGSALIGLQRYEDLGTPALLRWAGGLFLAAFPLIWGGLKILRHQWKANYRNVSWILKWSTILIVLVLLFEITLRSL